LGAGRWAERIGYAEPWDWRCPSQVRRESRPTCRLRGPPRGSIRGRTDGQKEPGRARFAFRVAGCFGHLRPAGPDAGRRDPVVLPRRRRACPPGGPLPCSSCAERERGPSAGGAFIAGYADPLAVVLGGGFDFCEVSLEVT